MKIITERLKAKNPSIADIKSVTIEHPKTSHILSKNTRQTEKVSLVGSCKSSNKPLNTETKKSENFLNK